MGQLIYAAITSLDGYTVDPDGDFHLLAPDEEVHAFVNDLEGAIGTYLYGRRMYDVMVAWETMDEEEPVMRDYTQVWRAAEKVVYSRTLESPSSARTRIERDFDPAAVRQLVTDADRDVSIAGPGLAGQAIAAGLVDEYHLFVSPVTLGGGTPALPDGARLELELVSERRFDSGVVHLHYRNR